MTPLRGLGFKKTSSLMGFMGFMGNARYVTRDTLSKGAIALRRARSPIKKSLEKTREGIKSLKGDVSPKVLTEATVGAPVFSLASRLRAGGSKAKAFGEWYKKDYIGGHMGTLSERFTGTRHLAPAITAAANLASIALPGAPVATATYLAARKFEPQLKKIISQRGKLRGL